MKTILMSVQPKHSERIISGEKILELRKVIPQCGVPFKVFMYESKGRNNDSGRQKVVAEFIVDEVKRYDAELFYDDDTFQSINEVGEDADGDEWEVTMAIDEEIDTCDLLKQACITKKELTDYLGEGINTVYALHISELKVYDTPKYLSEFKKQNKCFKCGDLDNLGCFERGCVEFEKGLCDGRCSRIYSPPQNWCYCEEGNYV